MCLLFPGLLAGWRFLQFKNIQSVMENKELKEDLQEFAPVFPREDKDVVVGTESFPYVDEFGRTQLGSKDVRGSVVYKGLSQRAYAAIELRIPESGEVWLDDMIKKANRRDLVQSAMQSMVSNPVVVRAWGLSKIVDRVYDFADEFLKQGGLKG